jgi:hypothetical protein
MANTRFLGEPIEGPPPRGKQLVYLDKDHSVQSSSLIITYGKYCPSEIYPVVDIYPLSNVRSHCDFVHKSAPPFPGFDQDKGEFAK